MCYVCSECTARLVNSLASYHIGRAYLLQHEGIIQLLYHQCRMETSDTPTRQHCLGALQKFSLRRLPQSKMIAAGNKIMLSCHIII
jgi:hypothetical protein